MFFYSRNYIKSFKILILTYIFLAIQTNAEERFFVTNETLFYNSEIETSNARRLTNKFPNPLWLIPSVWSLVQILPAAFSGTSKPTFP